MKKLLLLSILFFAFSAMNAQDFKPFQLYFGLGYAAPTDGGGGVLFDVEPTYRVKDEIAVGLRLESAAMAKIAGSSDVEITGVASYTLNGKYYLGNDTFRPYIGAGLGLYSMGSSTIDTNVTGGQDAEVSFGTKFGFYPRIGFDLGHFNINIDYNIIPKTEIDQLTVGTGGNTFEKVEVTNSYIGVRIGAFAFGGRN